MTYTHMIQPQMPYPQMSQFQPGYAPLQLNHRPQLYNSPPMPQVYQQQAPTRPSQMYQQLAPMRPPQTIQHQPTAPTANTSQPQELTTTTMVQCPICLQHMKYNVLDRHIDRCLQGDSRIPSDPPQASSSSSSSSSTPNSIMNNMSKMKVPNVLKRQQKPVDLGKKPVKMVYSMMSDKDLRDCLRSLSLPDHGDKQLKVWRHKEYINLYNANADSQNPSSAHVLRQQLQAMENAHLAEKSNQLKRKVTDFDSHKSKYADQFADLIASAKRSKSSK